MVRAHALIAAALVLVVSGCNCGREKLGQSGVCAPGDTQSCGHAAVGECHPGTQTCTYDDTWGPCEGDVEPVAESCDGKDNDCDGTVDDLADGGLLVQSCYDGPAGTQGVGLCQPGRQFCQSGGWTACDGEVLPATELCNGQDDDCDGKVDNQPDSGAALVQACYTGPDGTRGVGACSDGSQSCMGGAWTACAGSVVPAPETCNAIDDDCNGQVDDAIAPLGCYDGPSGTLGVGTCHGGFRMCTDGGFGACTGEVTPAAQDACDGFDEACDGTVNAGCPCAPGSSIACYSGPSGTQGVGECRAGVQLCGADGGYQACTGDVTPRAEFCNGQDDDCDGTPDNQPGSTNPLSQACYDGAAGTEGIGVCHGGTQTCQAASWSACQNEVVPSAEICDGRDNDCNGSPDNGDPGGGSSCTINGLKGPCAAGVLACADGGIVCVQITFPQAETCNGRDDDCDGTPDDFPDGGTIQVSCYDGGAGTLGVGVCRAGVSVCTGGAFAACTGEVMPSAEICNGKDDDCNGPIDDAIDAGSSCTVAGARGPCAAGKPVCSGASGIVCTQTVFPKVESCDGQDLNCDGIPGDYPDGGRITQSCYDFAAGTAGVGICKSGTQTCSGSSFGSCAGEVGPTAEVCNGKDDDCNGTPDDGIDAGSTCTVTGKLGPCASGKPVCSGASGITCTQTTFPGVETCNGSDTNCDGRPGDYPDGGAITQSCYDFGSGTPGVGICKSGTQTCAGSSFGACAGEVGPKTEVCNGQDDDCNGTRDDGVDAGSGSCATGLFGPCAVGHYACAADGGQVCVQDFTGTAPDNDLDGYDSCQDCNDNLGSVHPGATEICDGLDNNCNGQIDEGFDSDKDCYTTCGTAYASFAKLADGGCDRTATVDGGTIDPSKVDCDDTKPNVHPDIPCDCGAYDPVTGTCGTSANNQDDNCNSVLDETCACSNVDRDGDGYSPCQGDCDDSDKNVHPGAAEICDGKDDDCNPLTTDNCDVGEPCNFDGGAGQPSPDQCKSRYICATDVSTGVSSCGDLCNFSQTGAGVGDGCLAGTVCGANLIASDNDHVCVPSTGSGTRTTGSACTSNGQCRSNTCTGGVCTDLCGNDSYCGSATCTIADFAPSGGLSYTEVYGGFCQAALGTQGQGQTCGARPNSPHCKWGSLSCFQATGESGTECHQICCKQSDCPSGDYCGQGPSLDLRATITIGGTAYPADTGVPACLPKRSGQGSRKAGQACTSSLQCASDLCDSASGVCLDYCCNDSSCPTGLACEFVSLEKAGGHVQQARLCVAQPTRSLYTAAP